MELKQTKEEQRKGETDKERHLFEVFSAAILNRSLYFEVTQQVNLPTTTILFIYLNELDFCLFQQKVSTKLGDFECFSVFLVVKIPRKERGA